MARCSARVAEAREYSEREFAHCACCASDSPPCGAALNIIGSGRRSSRNSDRSPVAYASAGSSGGSSAAARWSRISSSDSLIGSMALTNGLDVKVGRDSWLRCPTRSCGASGSGPGCSRVDSLRRLLFHEAEHVAGNAAHLDLLAALRDSVAPVMTIDVFERHVPGVPEPAVTCMARSAASQHSRLAQ